MVYIITGMMICVFSLGMLNSPGLTVWGIAGGCLGVFLIIIGRRKSGPDDE